MDKSSLARLDPLRGLPILVFSAIFQVAPKRESVNLSHRAVQIRRRILMIGATAKER